MKFKEFIENFERLSALAEIDVPYCWKPEIEDVVLRSSKMHELPDKDAICFWKQIVDIQFYQLQLYVYETWDQLVEDDAENLDAFIEFLKKNSENIKFMNFAWVLAFWAKVLTTDKRDDVLPYVAEFLQDIKVRSDVQNYYFQFLTAKSFSEIMVALAEFCVVKKRVEVCSSMLLDLLPKLRKHYPDAIKAVIQKLVEVKNQADFSIKEVRDIYALYAQF